MRKLATLAALLLAGSPAVADTVTISLSENGGAYTTYNNVPVTDLFGVLFGSWTVYAREAGGAIPGTQGFEVNLFNTKPSSLWVVITSQNNTSPTGAAPSHPGGGR